MAIPVKFGPSSLDFGGVFPGSEGPNISVDPSVGPPAISFSGGVKIEHAPGDARVTTKISGDTSHFKVRDIIVMERVLEDVDCSELPDGCHHGPPPKVKVLEVVGKSDGGNPIQVKKDQVVLVRVEYQAPKTEGTFKAVLLINGDNWVPIQVPLSLFIAGIITTFDSTQVQIVQGAKVNVPMTVASIAGPRVVVDYEPSQLLLHTGVVITPTTVSVDGGQSRPATLTLTAQPDAPLGPNTLFVDQIVLNKRVGLLLPINVLPVPPPPPGPDPRVDHFDAIYVNKSTKRICQLTGGGDPEGKPHLNDTTRFALLGTDLGSSFDHMVNGERRTYFFFGDTHAGSFGGGEDDGDAIAFTTDDSPEPDGFHLQFIIEEQWRRLVIPGISLGNFEVPSGGFSHAGRLFIFATTGVLKTAEPPFMENSVLASASDAHGNFDLAYFVSRRDDNKDNSLAGGKFINVSPWKIKNNDWPGLPDNAVPGGEGLLLAGTGSYRRSAPYLAYVPLRPREVPKKEDWRYLHGFFPFEPGFGPNGHPRWSNEEPINVRMPVKESERSFLFFDDKIGELSFCWNADLKRWLLLYGGCAPGGCGIILRSAPMPWGPWSDPQCIFDPKREDALGVYMFECGPYGAYVISRYNKWDAANQEATIYYTLSNGNCNNNNTEPRYQVHLMKSTLRLITR